MHWPPCIHTVGLSLEHAKECEAKNLHGEMALFGSSNSIYGVLGTGAMIATEL